ncbi:MAG: hydantoinase/oxoprolinase family protein [Candidatus Tectomicrobia bacterium]|nr:hydantoinase/oxoprolinase family protein [Candidatus Tectomicrobia bacterium]
MAHIIGVDSGGTFTDCIAISDDDEVIWDKAPSTPSDLTRGVLASVENVARLRNVELEELLGATTSFVHGTTAAINALITRAGAKTGLITTMGHEDSILIGRVYQKVAGLWEKEVTHAVKLDKPLPLVPRPLIRGVTERIDYKGSVLVPLNQRDVEQAIENFLAAGVEAVAVSLLWSFMNPSHEEAIKRLIEARAPQLFVTLSSDIAPIMKEYERTATTVINSYLGPVTQRYMMSLQKQLEARKLRSPLAVMQSMGGVIYAEEARQHSVHLLNSGPVGGVIGSLKLASLLGLRNVIATDVGGTSFDVGLVVEGEASYAPSPIFGQYHVLLPMVDIVSIGAGGGSIASLEPETKLLRVGPQSAGASPGPVCYDAGGAEPTVTDADVILGRINPENFWGGRLRLNREKALRAIEERIARPLGMDTIEAAKGIIDIADAHMADLIRKVTIERGHDPRTFVLFAYGGGGPSHVGAYAKQAGISQAVVSPYAPVFSAFGIASSSHVRFYAKSEPMLAPFHAERFNAIFRPLEEAALADLQRTGLSSYAHTLARFVDLKFRRQVNEVRVPAPVGRELDAADMQALVQRFCDMYEQLYGENTAYAQAGIELTTFRVTSTVTLQPLQLKPKPLGPADPRPALKAQRPVFFSGDFEPTNVYDAQLLQPGNVVRGPAVIESPATSLPIHPGQTARFDEYLNARLDLG